MSDVGVWLQRKELNEYETETERERVDDTKVWEGVGLVASRAPGGNKEWKRGDKEEGKK